MLFSTAGMTLEFAVVTMRQRCCGCLAIQTKLCEEARTHWPWHASCLTHPAWLTPCPLPPGFISTVVNGQAVQARVEESIALATEQGFPRWRAQADFLRGWLLVEQGEKEAGIAQMVEAYGYRASRSAGRCGRTYVLPYWLRRTGKKGRAAEGLNVVTEALARAHTDRVRVIYEAELYRIKGELLLRRLFADESRPKLVFKKR